MLPFMLMVTSFPNIQADLKLLCLQNVGSVLVGPEMDLENEYFCETLLI